MSDRDVLSGAGWPGTALEELLRLRMQAEKLDDTAESLAWELSEARDLSNTAWEKYEAAWELHIEMEIRDAK